MKRYFSLLLFFFLASLSIAQTNTKTIVDDLMGKMTLDEKIGQLTLFTSGWDITGPTLNENYKNDVRRGMCGNLFNAHGAAYTRELQRIAVEETRLGIPLLFGYDVIHGYKTIYPIPLAEACSWNLPLIEKTARLSAKEAAVSGLHWTFNPMVDITRDPRWGRIAEGTGEDTYLGNKIAAAKVRGIQGDDLKDPFTVLACVKHFAAYGGAQAGRDYHTVDMSDRVFREIYLPPYKAAVDAGCKTVMTAFNELHGVPCSGSEYLLTDILRKEWGFKGFVVTDYTSINEMVLHGYSVDLAHAAEQAINAGVDMDMQGGAYQQHLKSQVEAGKVSIDKIDASVRTILEMKESLGLFEDPYRYSDVDREKEILFSQEFMDHALEIARQSIVLLKNDESDNKALLPLDPNIKNIALIGPLADNKEDMLGSWHASGDQSKVITVRQGLEEALPGVNIRYSEGCKTSGEDRRGFEEAISFAKEADLAILTVGEDYRQNGEAASRSSIGLPGLQQELVEKIYATGTPVLVLLAAGRPLTIEWIDNNIPAIVNTWHLGTMSGRAIADVLTGTYNPSGKLVITFPKNVGQIPIYYSMKNTGRPFSPNEKYTSQYIDVSNDPLYPFGYGLSYTSFEYSNLKLNSDLIGTEEKLIVTVDVQNTGDRAGEEVVQLYIRDLVGSVTRPVKELKGFQKQMIFPGEKITLFFELAESDLRFYNQDMKLDSESGKFKVFVGGSSVDVLETEFELLK